MNAANVVSYSPGAIVGFKLRQYCACACHGPKTLGMLHWVPCCKQVPGFTDFPDLDANGTPLKKLPVCPNCKEDELGVMSRSLVLCHNCQWKLVIEEEKQP